MALKRYRWPQLAIPVHLIVVGVASWQLAGAHSRLVIALWATMSGISLFVLTGLVHEASHRLLARSTWINELVGNLAGWVLLTPLSAYRAFHLKHHQTTNREDDPNAPLNSRWMLLFGSLCYVTLIHLHALRKLRGRQLARYLFEGAGMAIFLGALYVFLPRAVRERSWLLPLAIVALLQNVRIVSEHLDLPAGRYHDTWQLVLPDWLSRWLLHYDHHLEHHLRPGLHWHELAPYRAELIGRTTDPGLKRVTLGQFFRDVFLGFGDPAGRRWLGAPVRSDGAHGARQSRAQRRSEQPAKNAPARAAAARARLRGDKAASTDRAPEASERRYHGLDALRGATMLSVVALHAALAYAQVPIPNLIWAVRDPAAHPAFDLLCWWTLGISSPFFLMSGFFAAQLYAARGSRGFVANRARRIVAPFLVFGVFILPATFFVWLAGWLVCGQCALREFLRMKFHADGLQRNLYGPAHLWSLEYLAVMLTAFWIWLELRRFLPARAAGLSACANWLGRIVESRWRPFLLAVPTTVILWAGHSQIGLDAILDRQNSFLPEVFRLVHNSVFFAVGVMLHRARHRLGLLASYSWTYLIVSCPVFLARARLVDLDLRAPLVGLDALWLAGTGALFTWLITFGFLGLALGMLDRRRASLSYLADSSYWIYLWHLPIVGLLQVDLFPLTLPAAAKFLIVLSVTTGLGLASYQVLVRYTIIGSWLHGRRERPRAALPARPRLLRILKGVGT
jgi:peptidoglycan/LPS O-acetylase OafA/YrhL